MTHVVVMFISKLQTLPSTHSKMWSLFRSMTSWSLTGCPLYTCYIHGWGSVSMAGSKPLEHGMAVGNSSKDGIEDTNAFTTRSVYPKPKGMFCLDVWRSFNLYGAFPRFPTSFSCLHSPGACYISTLIYSATYSTPHKTIRKAMYEDYIHTYIIAPAWTRCPSTQGESTSTVMLGQTWSR